MGNCVLTRGGGKKVPVFLGIFNKTGAPWFIDNDFITYTSASGTTTITFEKQITNLQILFAGGCSNASQTASLYRGSTRLARVGYEGSPVKVQVSDLVVGETIYINGGAGGAPGMSLGAVTY